MDLKDLEHDKEIKEKLSNLRNSVQKIKKILDIAAQADTSQFCLKDKVDFDLFLTYALNALYWMYLKTKGEDPSFHDVKNQLARVKEYMVKAKQADERNTIRPKVNQAVAARFVKHGIHHKEAEQQPPNKKIKFAD